MTGGYDVVWIMVTSWFWFTTRRSAGTTNARAEGHRRGRRRTSDETFVGRVFLVPLPHVGSVTGKHLGVSARLPVCRVAADARNVGESDGGFRGMRQADSVAGGVIRAALAGAGHRNRGFPIRMGCGSFVVFLV